MERKPIPKGLRYSILERDRHTCQHCGATAPDVKLTVDHLIPVSAGGENHPDNLVAACVDCNAGKAAKISLRPVDNADLQARLDATRERRNILRATAKAAKEAVEARERRTWAVAGYWVHRFRGSEAKLEIPTRFFVGLSHVLDDLEADDLLPLIDTCAGKLQSGFFRREEDAIPYFFGCVKRVREQGQEARP